MTGPVRYEQTRSIPAALRHVRDGEWWHVHHETIDRFVQWGLVEDNVPGVGPDRYRITDAGLDELARYEPWRNRRTA